MKNFFFAFTFVFALFSSAGAYASFQLDGQVVGVSDGDTLTLLDGSRTQHRIRLAGIDAPESRQAFGQKSKHALSDLVYRKQVTAECSGNDQYARAICTIYADGTDVNASMVASGMAWVYRQYAPRNSPMFTMERDARSSGLGLWRDRDPVPPWEWRRDNKR